MDVALNAKLKRDELFFVIAKFLEDGPCNKAAQVLRQELEEKELLPKGKNWLGEDFLVTYEDVAKRNQHVTSDYLPSICGGFCKSLEESGQSRAKGKHSLIGSGLEKCIYEKKTTAQNDNSILRLAYERTGYSSGHLCTSLSTNKCFLTASRKVSTHFNHQKCLPGNTYQTMKQHRTVLGHLAPVFCVAFDRTGQRIISGADDDLVKVWSSRNGSLVATLRGHSAEITDISVSHDNHMIATGSLDKTVRVWCGHTSAPLAVLCGHHGHVTSVQISPSTNEDIRYVASTAKDGCLYFWTCDQSMTFSTVPVKFMEKNRVYDQTLCSAFSPGGTFFVTGGTDCIVRVYQCVPYPPILLVELPGHTDRIMTIQFGNTPSCTFSTGSCDGVCCIWKYHWSQWTSVKLVDEKQASQTTPNRSTGGSVNKSDKTYPNQVTMIGWEITDTYLISAHSPDCCLRVWRVKDGQLVSRLKGHTGEVFVVECHPVNSRLLLTGGHDGQIFIWDIIANTKLQTFSIRYDDEGIGLIFDCKWSPDGAMVVAADHLGYLTILGFGSSEIYQKIPDEQFFHTDYRPLIRDRNNYVVDEHSHTPPHLLPPPYLVDIDGHPHPLKQQESILQYIRPARLVKQVGLEEMEDYDDYMKKHFASVTNHRRKIRKSNEREEGSEEEQTPETQQQQQPLLVADDNENVPVTNDTPTLQSSGEPTEQRSHDELVDIIEDEVTNEGSVDNIQNMLSSIVYSLGLGDQEVHEAMKNWHRRNILPPIDNNLLCSEVARLQEIEHMEQTLYQCESERKLEVPSSPEPNKMTSPKGRSLRSGRTIPDEELITSDPLSPMSISHRQDEGDRESDRDYNEWDSASTASSDISDWTAEAGVNWNTSSSKRSRRTKIRETLLSGSDGITIDEEAIANRLRHESGSGQEENRRPRKRKERMSSSDEPPPKKKKVKSLKIQVSKEFDYSVYWPTSWLKLTKPQLSPYFPQVGDIIVYFRQGHALYREEVKKQKIYQWKNQLMPFEKYNLKSQELCQVKNVHFVVGPPTLCSITLALLSPLSDPCSSSSQQSTSSQSVTFKFKYHDMDGVLDFLILETVYKSSLKKQWDPGNRFQSFIDGSYWKGSILSMKPYQEEFPNSNWQCYHVRWDDGATDQLSPWDVEPLSADNEDIEQNVPRLIFPLSMEDEVTAWEREGEIERLISGLQTIIESLEEADMFRNPVDIEEEFLYCTVVPFPTDLSTILERLKNRFYRRKLALIWDVIAISRNASAYNEQSSEIVEHSKILNHTLLKFIKSHDCTDPMECYLPEVDQEEEAHQEITAPEVDYLDTEDVFTTMEDSSVLPKRKKSEDDESVVTNGKQDVPILWLNEAVKLLDTMTSSACAYPFMEPVNTEKYTDYCTVIQYPMDMTTLRNRLYEGEYPYPIDFTKDLKLVFNNAKTYNQQRSKIYKMAVELEKIYEKHKANFYKLATNGGTGFSHPYGTRRKTSGSRIELNTMSSSSNSSRSIDDDLSDVDSCSSWSRPKRCAQATKDENTDSSDNVSRTNHANSTTNEGKKGLKRSTRKQSNKRNYTEQENDETEEQPLESEGEPLEPRRITRSSKRKLVLEEDEGWEEDDMREGDSDDPNEYSSLRRSTRIRSSVKKTSALIDDDDWEEDREGVGSTDSIVDDNRIITTTRTGRVIKPTFRYS